MRITVGRLRRIIAETIMQEADPAPGSAPKKKGVARPGEEGYDRAEFDAVTAGMSKLDKVISTAKENLEDAMSNAAMYQESPDMEKKHKAVLDALTALEAALAAAT